MKTLLIVEKVREGFETNSSSSHSLVVGKKDYVLENEIKQLKEIFKTHNYDLWEVTQYLVENNETEFGWTGETITDIEGRLTYLIVDVFGAIANFDWSKYIYKIDFTEFPETIIKSLEDLIDHHITFPTEPVFYKVGRTSIIYIDHESSGTALGFINKYGLKKYLVSDIYILNDNDLCGEEYFIHNNISLEDKILY